MGRVVRNTRSSSPVRESATRTARQKQMEGGEEQAAKRARTQPPPLARPENPTPRPLAGTNQPQPLESKVHALEQQMQGIQAMMQQMLEQMKQVIAKPSS
eukprot:2818689-Amphidinium_carterae.1